MDIVSVSDAVNKGFRVLFDSDRKNCFNVINKTSGRVIRFPHFEGLYVRDNKKPPADCSMATSIKGVTQREIERAKRARRAPWLPICRVAVSDHVVAAGLP